MDADRRSVGSPLSNSRRPTVIFNGRVGATLVVALWGGHKTRPYKTPKFSVTAGGTNQ